MSYTERYLDIAREVVDTEIQGLNELKDSLGAEFIQAIELLTNTTGRIVVSGMGKSGHISRKIASTFSSMGTPAYFIHPAEASHGDLGMITVQDTVVLLSNSGETSELNAIINHCKRLNIKIIGITRRKDSTLYSISDIPLLLPNTKEASPISAPTTSATMMLVLGDAMAVLLQDYHRFSKDDFKALHPGGSIGIQLSKIYEVMHCGEEVPIVNENDAAIEAVFMMTKKRFGCTGVINSQGELVGIITDGDLRRHMPIDLNKTLVKEVMTKNPVTTDEQQYVFRAMSIMRTRKITVLFITKDKKPTGIIHLHDLLRIGVE